MNTTGKLAVTFALLTTALNTGCLPPTNIRGVANDSATNVTITTNNITVSAANTWTQPAPPNIVGARHAQSAVLLQNGKVLLIAGSGGLATCQIYDFVTNTWTATGSLNVGRNYNTATLLQSGKVLVTGGQTGGGATLNSAEIYDPSTGIWTTVAATMEKY
jgi:hypothetical protein